jgi:hypothetical protein
MVLVVEEVLEDIKLFLEKRSPRVDAANKFNNTVYFDIYY